MGALFKKKLITALSGDDDDDDTFCLVFRPVNLKCISNEHAKDWPCDG